MLDKLKQNIGGEERKLLDDITQYYATFPSAEEVGDKFTLWLFNVRRPNLSDEEKGLVRIMLESECDEESANTLYQSLKERVVLEKTVLLAEEILAGNSRKSLSDLHSCLEELKDELDSGTDKNIILPDIKELLTEVLGEGLDWKQVWMNQSCGPLRKGNLVCLVARPDTGKTSFLCGQANTFAKQLPPEGKILWFNNEQAGRAVLLRIFQEAVEMVNADMRRDGRKVEQLYMEKIGALDKIVVVDMPTLSKYDVELYCKKYGDSVGAIIIDQLWKVRGFGDDISDVKTQTRIANWARELAKTVAPVLGVYQADAQAEGQQYFGMDRIYMSKTAVQGEADLIVCMGRSFDDGKEKSRFFSFPKNKLSGGGAYFQEAMRSYKHESTFNSETGVFK
jgi:hypothetical protein